MTNPEEQGKVTASEEREKIAAYLDACSEQLLAEFKDSNRVLRYWEHVGLEEAAREIRDGAHHEGR